MTDCITHFFTKTLAAPRTGANPPIRPDVFVPPLPESTAIIWALVNSNGSISESEGITIVSRSNRGIYDIEWPVRRVDTQFIVSRYADNERFNNLNRSRWSEIERRTLNSCRLVWMEMGSRVRVDTPFSITIY